MRTCRRITFEGEWIPVEVPSDARCAAMRKLKNHLSDHEAHTAASSMLLKRKKVGLSIMSMPVKIIIRPILGKKKKKKTAFVSAKGHSEEISAHISSSL